MTKARVPHVALVLLPALLLAAVGVRAVTAEMRASEDAARERARSVASRLARSVDALVAEYMAPLPDAPSGLSDAEAVAAVAYLDPSGAFPVGHTNVITSKPLATVPSSAGEVKIAAQRVAVSVSPARTKADYFSKTESELARDAIATARRLADERAGGGFGAAALLSAAAECVTTSGPRWILRHEEARYEAAAGERARALETLRSAWQLQSAWEFNGSGNMSELDGTPYPEASLVLAAELLETEVAPPWIRDMYERCARNPWLADDASLDRAERLLGSAIPGTHLRLRKLGLLARELAKSRMDSPIHTASLSYDGGSLEVSVWRGVGFASDERYPMMIGGAVPRTVVEDRVLREVRALADDAGVISVVLCAPNATSSWGRWNASEAVDRVVETVPLAEPLSSWRAEAIVARSTGIPPTAWLLGAAVLVTTAALVGGMLALRRSAERSARLAEDRQTFLDHVAHELRTPAAAVQALTEELASGHVTKEREAAYREHLLRESRRLSALVEDTLDLTRLDAGRLAFKMEPADLRDVVRRAVEESDGAGRVIATLPDAPVVRAVDEATLRRAVKNLVENAIRHGGTEAPVRVTLEASDGAASITVADEGRGIAREHLPRLFERFYRVPSATHETKGVGLGLALCREVARAHGGDVGVTSDVGKGSTFTIRIPLA